MPERERDLGFKAKKNDLIKAKISGILTCSQVYAPCTVALLLHYSRFRGEIPLPDHKKIQTIARK